MLVEAIPYSAFLSDMLNDLRQLRQDVLRWHCNLYAKLEANL